MKKFILIVPFLLLVQIALADKIPFEYSVSYIGAFEFADYTGFGGASFQNVPAFISGGPPMNFELDITSQKDFKNIMVIVFQEYYCKTQANSCDSILLDQMPGNVNPMIKSYSEIQKGQTITIDGSFSSNDQFSSLDRTHLIIMQCPDDYCEEHTDEFWSNYYHHYYNFNHLNSTVMDNEAWKYFRWGKVLVDDPFAGIWCPIN